MSTQKEKGRTLCWHNNDEFRPENKFVYFSEGEEISLKKEKRSNFSHKQKNNSHSVCSLRTLQQKICICMFKTTLYHSDDENIKLC